jgi:hypothetical protein
MVVVSDFGAAHPAKKLSTSLVQASSKLRTKISKQSFTRGFAPALGI